MNKLWTSDNICIFKSINIPVKLTFDDAFDEGVAHNGDNAGTGMDTRLNRPQACDTEESVDSGVRELNHDDICVDIEGNDRIACGSSGISQAKSADDSLNSFLKRLDGDMKASIQTAKKQRYFVLCE